MKSIAATLPEARRIAVRAQGLAGGENDILSLVRRLGFLQMDPIATVAPPQHLVLFGRLGRFDTAELDRLLWQERKPVEWDAFICAPREASVPGLRSKTFTIDEENREAVNFYVWESEEAARAFFTDELRERITGFYGVAPTIQFLDVAALVDNS